MAKKTEIIAELKKLARKSRDARQQRQYDIVRLYLEGRNQKQQRSWICPYKGYTMY